MSQDTQFESNKSNKDLKQLPKLTVTQAISGTLILTLFGIVGVVALTLVLSYSLLMTPFVLLNKLFQKKTP